MLGCVIPSMDLRTRNRNQSALHNLLAILDCFYPLDSSFSLASILLFTTHVIEDISPLVGVVFLILTNKAIHIYMKMNLYIYIP